MRKSVGNALGLSAPPNVVAKKVKIMFTDPRHLRVEHPGHIEGNMAFTHLGVFDPGQA